MINSHPSKHLALCQMLLLCLWSCGVDDTKVEQSQYTFQKPTNFPEPTYTFDNNPVTKEGFELGRKLFFDPILSKDNSVSCNNCHQQSRAFADFPLHPVSRGIDDKSGIRNAPSLTNMAFFPEFFWDGGVTHLDFVPINAIESAFEMGETLAHVVEKLNNHNSYPTLFKKAFGTKEITSPFMLHALSQFTSMMISANSPYDKYVRGETVSLTTEQLEGMTIFERKCGECHSGELFTDFSYRNNGISSKFIDLGRGRISENESDYGKFRVPSLRNATITAPYMHNAKFQTLEEVLDHYDQGMIDSPTLDPIFKRNTGVVGISLTADEKRKIIAFIGTLTDKEFTSNPKFKNHD